MTERADGQSGSEQPAAAHPSSAPDPGRLSQWLQPALEASSIDEVLGYR